MLFSNTVLVSAAAFVCGMALSGCNAVHEPVEVSELLQSLTKAVEKDGRKVETYALQSPRDIDSFPLIKEVCSTTFDRPGYEYDGTMMRIKINKSGYNLSGAQLYRHEYAICFGFYPAPEGQTQRALYVQYLGTIKSDHASMISKIAEIAGGYEGLLLDSKYHVEGINVTQNDWHNVPRKAYTDETSKVQYFKMNPVEMKAVHRYAAEKFTDLMGFELLDLTLRTQGDQFTISEVDKFVVKHSMNPNAGRTAASTGKGNDNPAV
jgi:hypothetical protein